MDILQGLSTLTGWPGLVFLILSVIFGGIYIRRASKSQADAIAKKADREAIESLQRQVAIQGEEIATANARIKHLEAALAIAGIHVAIDGRIEHIYKEGQEL